MIVANVFDKYKRLLLYIGYSRDKLSFYKFQNAFVNSRNMAYIVNKLSTNPNCIRIDESISLMDNEFNFNELIKANHHDTVKFEIHQYEFKNYRVLFFRKPVDSSNVISQVHLYNDKLLYARVTFDYLVMGDNYRKSIISEISNKYHLKQGILKEKSIMLKDSNNNRLKIIDNGKIILQYISGNKKLLRKFYKESSIEKNHDLEEYQRRRIIASFI